MLGFLYSFWAGLSKGTQKIYFPTETLKAVEFSPSAGRSLYAKFNVSTNISQSQLSARHPMKLSGNEASDSYFKCTTFLLPSSHTPTEISASPLVLRKISG